MNAIDYLIKQVDKYTNKEALIWKDQAWSYQDLKNEIQSCLEKLEKNFIACGNVVILQADFSPKTIAMLLALLKTKAIVAILDRSSKITIEDVMNLTNANYTIRIDEEEVITINKKMNESDHEYWEILRERNQAGLIIFSSGSTGKSKAIVHDANQLFKKFMTSKKATRVIGFLLFDHIGGINTLFYTLFNGGCFISIKDRSPSSVCKAIEAYKADALTTTPTFLNLLLLSKAYETHDLSTLKYINFSTEKMGENTYKNLQIIFPSVRLSQAYGLSEVGVLPAQSTDSESLLIKLDRSSCDYRISEGMLEVKIDSSMLGYLNAPSPFTEDGWYKTGDSVELVGDYLKILGRKSEMINVGGEKVYPAEIEEVIESMPGVVQAAISSEPHAMIGQLISLKVFLNNENETIDQFKLRLNQFCKTRLASYKIPKKIYLSSKPLHGDRFKKMRLEKNNSEVNYECN